MKKIKNIGYNDIVLLQHEYASNGRVESMDYVMSCLTKKR